MKQKTTRSALLLSLSVSLLGACSTNIQQAPAQTQNSNNGQNTDAVRIHDPVIMRQDGTYYLFGTGDGISVYESQDLTHWQATAPVFETPPGWTYGVVDDFSGHIWAPDITEHDGRYYLYYSISSGGKNTSAIGVATNETLDPSADNFQWVDHGPVVRSVPYRDMWNAIDAHVVTDEQGVPWMSFGSFWGGLKLVKLTQDRLSLAEPQEWYSIAKRERSILVDDKEPEPAAIEAPFIFKKNGYYYLFASWDYCCRGVDSTYKIVVGRSKQLQGPYLDKNGTPMTKGGGTLVLAGNENWPGTGHNSVYTFDGKDYLVFHAYDTADNGKSKLKIIEIDWTSDQWPSVDKKQLSAYSSVLE
jgi:arabinan endo-1,5-alpha-L-arabinosidase